MDCNNLQNSYVRRILFVLCFWGEGGWLGALGGGGGVRGGGLPNFMVVFWNTLHPQYTYLLTGPLLRLKFSLIMQVVQFVSFQCKLLSMAL